MTAAEVLAALKAVLQEGSIQAVAVEEPPKRQQSHDDEDPRVIRSHMVCTPVLLMIPELEPEPGLRRGAQVGTPIGAVVVTGDSTWVLVKAEYTGSTDLMDNLRRACDLWGRQAIDELNAQLEHDLHLRRGKKRRVS